MGEEPNMVSVIGANLSADFVARTLTTGPLDVAKTTRQIEVCF